MKNKDKVNTIFTYGLLICSLGVMGTISLVLMYKIATDATVQNELISGFGAHYELIIGIVLGAFGLKVKQSL